MLNEISAAAVEGNDWQKTFRRQPASSLQAALLPITQDAAGVGDTLMVRSNERIATGLDGGYRVWPVTVPLHRPTIDRTDTCVTAAPLLAPNLASSDTAKLPDCE